MSVTAALFALPACLVGAWYMLHAGSAARLAEREGERANRIRVRLRRLNGVTITLAGLLLYFVISRIQGLEEGGTAGVLLPIATLMLLPVTVLMLVFAWLDMRLTKHLKNRIGRDALRSAMVLLVFLLVGCGEETATPVLAPAASTQAQQSTPATPAERPQPQNLPTAEIMLNDTPFTLMVADDANEQQTGLMYRREMAPDEGMIFVFDGPTQKSFWMQNTYLPLDLIFLDASGVVLNIEQGRPLREVNDLRSDGPAQFVIEINKDRAAAVGVEAGTKIDVSPALDMN